MTRVEPSTGSPRRRRFEPGAKPRRKASTGSRCSAPDCSAPAQKHRGALPYCPAHCGCRACAGGIDAYGRDEAERAARRGRGGGRWRGPADRRGASEFVEAPPERRQRL